MWKRILSSGVITVALAVTAGNAHFKNKVEEATQKANDDQVDNPPLPESSNNNDEIVAEAAIGDVSYMKYMKNLPQAVKDKVKKGIDTKTPIQLVIVGDEAVAGWPSALAAELDRTYGANVFQVTVKSYAQKTTKQWLEEKLVGDVASAKPDIVLYEPALLVDAGVIERGETIQNVTAIVDELTKAVPGVALLVQPPNPLYQAKRYPVTVALLQETLEGKGISYVNHWSAWPDANSADILKYLEQRHGFANAQGQAVWASYLVQYFTANVSQVSKQAS